MKTSSPIRRVAVVGAGLAGLTAARVLAGRGFAVTVFDKGRGPGGRLSRRRHGPYHFDHGAQYFTARDDGFRREVRFWIAAGVAAPWKADLVVLSHGRPVPKTSAAVRYTGVPGMNAIGKHLARDLDVRLQSRVTGVERAEGGWALTLGDASAPGDLFDAVVLAVPAPQAVDLLDDAPAVRARLQAVEMDPCWCVMAACDRRLHTAFDAAFLQGSPLAWAARNSSKPGRPEGECWVLHATAAWSREHLELEPAAVETALWQAFEAAVGSPLPGPVHRSAHRWRYASVPTPLGQPCLWDEPHRLGVCGDGCTAGRIEGAWLSGRAMGDAVAASG